MELLIPLMAAAAPFVVWPIEFLFPYPFVVEEVIKAVIVSLVPRNIALTKGLLIMVLSGILFTLTESIFYLFNISAGGDFLTRWLLTVALHSGTFVLIYLPVRKSPRLTVVGLLGAIVVHYIYNQLVIQPA